MVHLVKNLYQKTTSISLALLLILSNFVAMVPVAPQMAIAESSTQTIAMSYFQTMSVNHGAGAIQFALSFDGIVDASNLDVFIEREDGSTIIKSLLPERIPTHLNGKNAISGYAFTKEISGTVKYDNFVASTSSWERARYYDSATGAVDSTKYVQWTADTVPTKSWAVITNSDNSKLISDKIDFSVTSLPYTYPSPSISAVGALYNVKPEYTGIYVEFNAKQINSATDIELRINDDDGDDNTYYSIHAKQGVLDAINESSTTSGGVTTGGTVIVTGSRESNSWTNQTGTWSGSSRPVNAEVRITLQDGTVISEFDDLIGNGSGDQEAVFTAVPNPYQFPSTNENNKNNNHPYVELVESRVGEVELKFVNDTNSLAFFEYRVDGNVLTSGTSHYVVNGDFIYGGVSVDSRGISEPVIANRTFSAGEKVEVRLALGGERDWDFDWVSFDVLPDTTKPTIVLNSGLENALNPANYSVTATDDVELDIVTAHLRRNGSNTLVKSCSKSNTGATSYTLNCAVPAGLEDGQYNVRYNARDAAGNLSVTSTAYFIVDNTAPTATLTFTGGKVIDGKRYVRPGDTIKYTVTANDDGSGLNRAANIVFKLKVKDNGDLQQDGVVCGSWSNGKFANGSNTLSGSFTMKGCNGGVVPDDRLYGFAVRVYDNAGNYLRIDNAVYTVDGTKPVVSDFNSPDLASSTLNLSAKAIDLASGVEYVRFFIADVQNGECKNNYSALAGYANQVGYLEGDVYNTSFDTSALDGEYCVLVSARDNATNNSTPLFKKITIDNTAPEAPSELNYVTTSGRVLGYGDSTNELSGIFSWSEVSDAVKYGLYTWNENPDSDAYYAADISGKHFAGWFTSLQVPGDLKATGAQDYPQYVCITAIDAAGNESDCSEIFSAILDQTAPDTPTILQPLNEQFFSSSSILNKWSAVSDLSGVTYQIAYQYDDGHSFGSSTCAGETLTIGDDDKFIGCRTLNATQRNHVPGNTEQGGVTIWVRSIDGAGNKSDWSLPTHYYFDATAPEISIITPINNSLIKDSFSITGTVSDNMSLENVTVIVLANDVEVMSADAIIVGNDWSLDIAKEDLPDGIYQIKAFAKDSADNTAEATAVEIEIDNTAPSAPTFNSTSLTEISGDAEANSMVTVFVDSAEVGTSNTDEYGIWSFIFDPALLEDIEYLISATATDKAGNTSATAEATLLVEPEEEESSEEADLNEEEDETEDLEGEGTEEDSVESTEDDENNNPTEDGQGGSPEQSSESSSDDSGDSVAVNPAETNALTSTGTNNQVTGDQAGQSNADSQAPDATDDEDAQEEQAPDEPQDTEDTESSNEGNQDIAGARDEAEKKGAFAWYWWVAILAALSGGWWIVFGRRNSKDGQSS